MSADLGALPNSHIFLGLQTNNYIFVDSTKVIMATDHNQTNME